MFKGAFQGGPTVEVFSAQGKEPLSQWKQVGNTNIQKKFDKEVKSYVIHLEGSNTTTRMQLPKESKQSLGLTQRYVILQIFVYKDKDFCLDLGVSDGSSKRRLVLSTTHKETHVTPLHTKLPVGVVHKSLWLNLCFDLLSLVTDIWKGEHYKSLESISIQGTCKLRRIFTMKGQPIDTTDDDAMYGCPSTNNNVVFEDIPKQCVLAPDVRQVTQVINVPKLHCYERKLKEASRSSSEQDLNSSFGSSFSQSKRTTDDHNHSRKHTSSSHAHKKADSERKDSFRDLDHKSNAREQERKTSGKARETERKGSGKEIDRHYNKDNERKGSGKEVGIRDSDRKGSGRETGVRDNERKGSGKEGERRGMAKENAERKGSGKENDRSKLHSKVHHSRSKSDSVTGNKEPSLQVSERAPPVPTPSKKVASKHSSEIKSESRKGQRERRDSDPGASQVDDEIVVDKDSLRSSHTWTDGADGKDQIPFVKPHPPSEPSSAKHRRPPRVKSAGKERTPHAGHVFYLDSAQSGSSANATPPNGEVEPPKPNSFDQFQMADTTDMDDILRSMQRENGQAGRESESDVDSIAEVIGMLNNRTDDNTGGEYEESEGSVLSDDRSNTADKLYTYSSKPKEAPHKGGQQTPTTRLSEPYKLLQQHKSNRTRVRKKSHEKKIRTRNRNAGAVGAGDSNIVNGHKGGGMLLNGVTNNDSEFVVNQSSDDEDNNPTPRQLKKRSPRTKPLKRSQNTPQYSDTIYNENRLQNNLVRISPLGKPMHSTYRIDPAIYSQQGLHNMPPTSLSPHLLQTPIEGGTRRSQGSVSFSRRSLREIPHDEIRRSGGSRVYNKEMYEMTEYLSESRERSMLMGMCSDDELHELDEQEENDLTKKNEYHFTAGSSSEDNTPQSTLKATGERDHDYLEEMERNKFSDENPLTHSNQRLFSPDMFRGQGKTSPYHLSPNTREMKVYNTSSQNDQSSEDEELELMFDYVLGCYFDPHTGIYYQLK